MEFGHRKVEPFLGLMALEEENNVKWGLKEEWLKKRYLKS